MKKIFIISGLVLMVTLISAKIVTFSFDFEEPVLEKKGEYCLIYFDNTTQFGKIGEPSLPYLGIKLLLPEGEKASSIKVTRKNKISLEGNYTLLPVQPQLPLSSNIKYKILDSESHVYSQNKIYPEKAYNALSTYYLSGFSIGFTAVTPIEYNPKTGKINYYKNITVEILTEPVALSNEITKFLHYSDFIVNLISKTVNNPEKVSTYNLPASREDEIDYIIITEEAKVDIWQNFADLYTNRGQYTEIETIEFIITQYPGIDTQEKIRNFLIEKYTDYAVKYVLLAGDTDIIPHRGLYGIVNEGTGNETTDYDIPADMYYSCLDRGDNIGNGPDWNNDGDNMWGEPGEADLVPEFAIGRLPYNNDGEIFNFINKVDSYLNSPVEEELTSALLVGEDLGWTAWGGDYMDELIGVCNTYGHTTVGIPTEWDITTLYDRDYVWAPSDLYSLLSNGPNLINHLGHSSTYYNMKIYTTDVNEYNITNNGTNHNFSIIFTQGCYAGAFDNRNAYGSYGSDCTTEKFVSIANAAVSMVSHSRYGWGSGYNTNGASQFYNREFVDSFFGEDIFDLGYALNDAKIDAIPFMSGVMYWVDYQTNLTGDPALSVWTDIPEQIDVTHPNEIIVGTTEINISSSVSEALVVVLLGNEILGIANTDLSGEATIYFEHPVEDMTELTINLIKHNYSIYHGIITPIPAQGAYVVCDDVNYHESGNYIDGLIQSLDTVFMDITLNNVGLDSTPENVYAILQTDCDFVTLLDSTLEISALNSMETITIENAFQIELLYGIPDNTFILFTIDISSGDNSWQSNISLNVHSPILEYQSYTLNVLTGDDQILNPGDTAEIFITISNTGSGYSYNVYTSLFSYDPYINTSGSASITQIDPGSQATTTEPFILEVSTSCPEDYYAELELLAYDDIGGCIVTSFSIPIGINVYDFENENAEWEHTYLSAGYSDEWHLESYRNYTNNGSFSMKCGGEGSANYSDYLHSGMLSPLFIIPENSFIKFYHWMDAETQSSTQAWDGGLIEIAVNGSAFSQIEPVNGYPYSIVSNTDSPFNPGTPVFSGSVNWEEIELDLSEYSGVVQLRFVFGSDANVTGEGWYIDDVTIGSYVDIEEETIIPVFSKLEQNIPNPFNPSGAGRSPATLIQYSVDKKADVLINIYNIKGQLIKTLVDENKEPGIYSVNWQGEDNNNRKVTSGIYFYKMRSGKFTSVKKMILMK